MSVSDDHNQSNIGGVQSRNTPEADFIFTEFNPNMPSVGASRLTDWFVTQEVNVFLEIFRAV